MLIPLLGLLIFPLVGLLPVALGAAFVVTVDSITDRGIPRQQRLAGILLSAAVVPATILPFLVLPPMTATGISPPRPVYAWLLPLIAIPVWVLVLVRVKPTIWAITKKSDWKP
jgi:hypothetical protein